MPHPTPPARPHEADARSYLLRVRRGPGGARYALQDLRTGERRSFASALELQRWLDVYSRAALR